MLKNIHSFFYSYWFLISIIIVYSPRYYAQFDGLSIHAEFLSFNFPSGFDKNYYRPGNFMGGLQYNSPINTDFEINAGFDCFYTEATGLLNNEPRQVEVFIPSVFAGFVFNFDNWGIFGKAGYSPAGSINQHGSQAWISYIPGFDMYPIQVGVKFNIYNDLDLTASVGNYIGKSVKIDEHIISLSTMNLGLSYNLFGSYSGTLYSGKSTNDYKQMYGDLLTENEKLESQNSSLTKQMTEIIGRLNKSENNGIDSVVAPAPQLVSISIDSINLAYNLHIGQPLNLRAFVNRNRVSEDGKLILEEYNSIAASFKGFSSGIWLICSVPDTNTFFTTKQIFPRIDFRHDSGIQKSLVINIDVNKTETNNHISLEIK